jgi:hypothetical protein
MLPRPTHGRVVAAMCAAAAVALVGFSQLELTAHYPSALLASWLGHCVGDIRGLTAAEE